MFAHLSKLEVPKERRKRVGLRVWFVSYSLVYGLLSGFPLRTSDGAAHLVRSDHYVHVVSLFLSALQLLLHTLKLLDVVQLQLQTSWFPTEHRSVYG